jgi:hypothetical protein
MLARQFITRAGLALAATALLAAAPAGALARPTDLSAPDAPDHTSRPEPNQDQRSSSSDVSDAVTERSLSAKYAAGSEWVRSDRTDPAASRVRVLHTYNALKAREITSLITIKARKLERLLPAGYQLLPASALALGRADQGIVALSNYHGLGAQVDRRPRRDQVAIDIAILVAEPADAAQAGLSIPGAYHLYALKILTDDPIYAASLRRAGMPVRYLRHIGYDRQIDDPSGAGTLTVNVPANRPLLRSIHTAFGYQPAGTLDPVFWFNGSRGVAALHFHDVGFEQGQALSQIYTQPGSNLDNLLAGGGIGTCPRDPQTGDNCVTSQALNFRFPQGSRGQLTVIRRSRANRSAGS